MHNVYVGGAHVYAVAYVCTGTCVCVYACEWQKTRGMWFFRHFLPLFGEAGSHIGPELTE